MPLPMNAEADQSAYADKNCQIHTSEISFRYLNEMLL